MRSETGTLKFALRVSYFVVSREKGISVNHKRKGHRAFNLVRRHRRSLPRNFQMTIDLLSLSRLLGEVQSLGRGSPPSPRREHAIQLQQLRTIPLISTFDESSLTFAIVSSFPPSKYPSILHDSYLAVPAAIPARQSMDEFRLELRIKRRRVYPELW